MINMIILIQTSFYRHRLLFSDISKQNYQLDKKQNIRNLLTKVLRRFFFI